MKLHRSEFELINICHKNGQCNITLKDCQDLKVIFHALTFLSTPKSTQMCRNIYAHLLTLVTSEQMKTTKLSREEVVTAWLTGYYEPDDKPKFSGFSKLFL